jgi:hypothetical protein
MSGERSMEELGTSEKDWILQNGEYCLEYEPPFSEGKWKKSWKIGTQTIQGWEEGSDRQGICDRRIYEFG